MFGLARFRIVNLRARDKRLQNIRQHLRIRTRRQRTLLRAAQLSCRDHFHGLGDLPRVDHAANAASDVENICHKSVACVQLPVNTPAILSAAKGLWMLLHWRPVPSIAEYLPRALEHVFPNHESLPLERYFFPVP